MFATIYVPDFALQCVLRHEPELCDGTLAVVDGGLPARVRQMTPAARERGVVVGMTTTQALGRCPTLRFRTVGESLLAPAGALLLQVAESFSPWLEATGEGVVTLQWRGDKSLKNAVILSGAPPWMKAVGGAESKDPVKLTNGVPRESNGILRLRSDGCAASAPLRMTMKKNGTQIGSRVPVSLRPLHEQGQEIVAQLAACGFSARVGVAASPDLALLAAHAAVRVRVVVAEAADFLAPLPVEALAADGEAARTAAAAEKLQIARAEIFRLLRRWGIRTLGAFAALPREQVVVRLGGLAGELWDRAAGVAQRPLRLLRAPEIFAEAMELEHEVETLEPLLFILRRFLEQLAARLAAAYRVAATLKLRLTFRDGAPHVRDFHIPAPTRDVNVLFRVLSTHLEGVTAAAPIVAIALSAQAVRPEQQQFGLFESGLRDPNKFFETLARLHALLGNDRVGTPVAENTHCPDAFHLETPCFDEMKPALGLSASDSRLGPPLQRYRPPLPANVQEQNGRPVRVFSDKVFGEITGTRGPWRESGDFWAERAWERVEWDVEVGGELYRLAQQGGVWFIDGAYD